MIIANFNMRKVPLQLYIVFFPILNYCMYFSYWRLLLSFWSLLFSYLSWNGIVKWMDWLYWLVQYLKRYRDESQRVLRACNIRKQHLEATATDRKTWRSACMVGLKSHEASRLQWLQERRKKRKEKNTVPSTQTSKHICSDCGRDCNSPIGLFSHKRVHKTKQWVVIVGFDGLQ